MMSDNPLTGWEFKGTVLPVLKHNAGNSHAGIFPYKDKWYIAYHNRKVHFDRVADGLEMKNNKQRSVNIDELEYNDDFTIKTVTPTQQGPKQLKFVNAYERNEAETFAAQSYLLPGIEVEDVKDIKDDRAVTEINNGDWIKIGGVDFGTGAKQFTARVAAAAAGSAVEIRLDSTEGTIVGTCDVAATGGFDKWINASCEVNGATGVHDLYLKFVGGSGFLFNLNWWQFSNGATAKRK